MIIYFDNAATSCPKPLCVKEAVTRMLDGYYSGNAGRGAHPVSLAAAKTVYDARLATAEFFGCDSPEKVVFTYNATYALNIAIGGVLRRGDNVIISNLEHNSVLRPLAGRENYGVSYSVFDALCGDDKIIENIKKLVRQNTRLLVCTHVSNVIGKILPIARIGALCKKYGIIFVLDASQSAGSIKIDVNKDNIDILCAPGHKGLLGPQGSGFLIVNNENLMLSPYICGGNGVNSLETDMGMYMPERLEGGTVGTPAIAGLHSGIKYVSKEGIDGIFRKEKHLADICRERIGQIKNVNIIRPEYQESGIVLFTVGGKSSSDVAKALANENVCVRSGYHCASLAHKALGTTNGGCVSASFGIFNSENEVFIFAKNLDSLIKKGI